MKYFTKEWQRRVSDAPDSAKELLREAYDGYRAEQGKHPIPEDFERNLEFHDAKIGRVETVGDDLHIWFDDPGFQPLGHTHLLFRKARIKKQEHTPEGCYFIYYEIYRHYLGYEMDMLLWYPKGSPASGYADFTVLCEDIETDTPWRKRKKKH